jgi:hypothetical protein
VHAVGGVLKWKEIRKQKAHKLQFESLQGENKANIKLKER